MLASLFNVFKNDIGRSQFSFANNDQHVLINRALREQGYDVDDFVLDPIPAFDPGVWLRQHQDVHNRINQILGIVGNDLTAVDFNSVDQVASWIWLHANEHRQANDILGIQ